MTKRLFQTQTSQWLLLLYALPASRNSQRVNLWRKLKTFGAVQLKTSGYVLPDDPAQYERCQWLSKQVRDAGGEATLVRVGEIDGISDLEVRGMFNQARTQEYKELAVASRATLVWHKKGAEAKFSAELEKCQRRFRQIRAIDYFNSPGVHDAQVALERVKKALAPRKRSEVGRKLDSSAFVGKTWLTRPRPGIDRAGSAWLIRRFIDDKARFVFGMDPAEHPKALPFDMADVDFSHHGEDCTFETLVKRFGIVDRAVLRMAEMVHDADLEDEKFHSNECIGINCVLNGWAHTGIPDGKLLDRGMDCFEGLYRNLRK
ncbi:MAG TPA: chromate resistance protein ChrB domain-containing protein [Verrucomicrobiae bacterium]|nr:chromate resistance protein ChrB domain-containing protein [Verrucomicrobiae bacterium]